MTEMVDRLTAEVREQNELYEAGATDRAFWLAQRHRLEAMKEADPKLTQTAIGELIGKGKSWVSAVMRHRFPPRWKSIRRPEGPE